ncbi:M16 family metallopeptidase [Brevundimonas balnearis]|uniref:M16 family metallopeptidase n=1 Tax=Brevundimonas balnearis TaxID=1572858 RepID=A0ABV6R588_9CAUL
MRLTAKSIAVAAALSVALPAGLPAWAQTAAPSSQVQAAAVADLIAGVDIPYETFTLDNGLRVIVHTDRSSPIVATSIWYNVGSKDEPAGRTGFAHLFEHLMFSGSENAPGSYISRLVGMGATDLNGTTWFDRTNYFQTVATPVLEQVLYLESDRMGHLLGALTQEQLDTQRGVVQNEKRQGDNQPYGLVQYARLEALFPEGHPYRHSTIGSMADLDAASMDDVRSWFIENYGPNNAVLVLAGDVDVATARELVERHFGSIPRGPANVPAQAAVPTLDAPVSRVMRDRVANVRIYRSWTGPGLTDADAVPLAVGAAVLGGLASSRLDNALVRGDQTAVSVSSSYQPFQRVGFFDVIVNVKPGEDPDAVAARVDEIMAQFLAEGPTADEVQRVATQQVAQRINGLESIGGFGGRATVLAEGALYADDPEFYKSQLRAYAEVTPDQVREVMNRWLSRPVFSLRVEPGEREAYVEAQAVPSGEQVAAAPADYTPTARPPLPGVGEIPDLDFPDVQRTTLSNGIPVIFSQAASTPTTRVAVEFDAGWAADPADRLGLQALMLEAMSENAGGLDAAELAEARERLGASISADASLDRTFVTLSALTPNLAPSLDLLAKVVREPDFIPSEVERLRAQQLSQIAAELSSPGGLGSRALWPALYGEGSAYGRPTSGLGETDHVQAVTLAEIQSFRDAWIRPDNAKIFVVSDRPLAEVTAALEAEFGDWRAPAAPRGQKAEASAAPAQPRIILIDRPQSPQSLILGGQVLGIDGDDDRLVLDAATEVLGTGFSSRINSDLRETRGWSYGARSSVNGLEGPMPYLINAPVQADRTGDSIASTIAVHQAFLGPQGVTPEELTRIIDAGSRRLAGQFATAQAVLGTLRSNDLYGRSDTYWEEAGARYRGLTAEALDAAARQAYDPSRFVWVVVGDAEVVRPQLEQLGLPVEVRSNR